MSKFRNCGGSKLSHGGPWTSTNGGVEAQNWAMESHPQWWRGGSKWSRGGSVYRLLLVVCCRFASLWCGVDVVFLHYLVSQFSLQNEKTIFSLHSLVSLPKSFFCIILFYIFRFTLLLSPHFASFRINFPSDFCCFAPMQNQRNIPFLLRSKTIFALISLVTLRNRKMSGASLSRIRLRIQTFIKVKS